MGSGRDAKVRMTFRKLSEADLPLLAEWLARPHVAEWWGGGASMEEVRGEYLPLL
jgi:RimJ/RimL family protein N-acetyltransferase